MSRKKPRKSCPHCKVAFQTNGIVVRKGSFQRRDGSTAKVYFCQQCGKHFSCRTKTELWRSRLSATQHKLIHTFFISGVSRRKTARNMGVTHNTIDRKFPRLCQTAKLEFERFQNSLPMQSKAQFDEMRSHEHTKMKPLSIPLVVTPERLIISIGVAAMAADGPLAAKSRKKYPTWKDERGKVIPKVLKSAQHILVRHAEITTDEAPGYPNYLSPIYPEMIHIQVEGGRGCIVGQGELKRKGFDKMFALNHTAAMIRDNCSPLKRKTWTTTKKRKNLEKLLVLYAVYHNKMVFRRLGRNAQMKRN